MGMFGDVLGPVLGFIGGERDRSQQNDINKWNTDVQKEFAQNGVKWRVDDAARAGVGKLAALGANLTQPSPSSVFSGNSAQTFANMGQGIGRAIDATRTRGERAAAVAADNEARQIQLENGHLQNELLRAQIIDTNRRASNPAFPRIGGSGASPGVFAGQGDAAPGTSVQPVQVSAHTGGSPAKAAGAHADLTYVHTGSGGLAIVPSQDSKNLIEDQFIPETLWAARNHLATFVTPPPYPSDVPLPKGYSRWKWLPLLQEWRPVRGNEKSLGDRWRGFVDRVRRMPVQY